MVAVPMREALIIIPQIWYPAGSQGERVPVYVESPTQVILEHFNGVTVSKARGFWQDENNVLFDENVYQFTIAMHDNATNEDLLRAIARRFAWRYEQKSIYLRLPNGNVEFITRERGPSPC